jgi:hypothetical protein
LQTGREDNRGKIGRRTVADLVLNDAGCLGGLEEIAAALEFLTSDFADYCRDWRSASTKEILHPYLADFDYSCHVIIK